MARCMTDSEILVSWRQAKNRTAQITILSELNCVTPVRIIEILREQGASPDELPKSASRKWRKWSDEEIEKMRAMQREGYSREQIALQFGITKRNLDHLIYRAMKEGAW